MKRTISQILACGVAGGSLVAIVLPIANAASTSGGYHPVDAAFLALGVLLLVTAVLLLPIRSVRVAKRDMKWTDVAGTQHDVRQGWIVPPDVADADAAPERGVSALRTLYRGKDNRASTSKAVALAWTYAIVFGLVMLLALKLMGDGKGWDALTASGSLRPEYLLLLGGPYAAAVIAKYAAVSGSAGDTKTSAPDGEPSAAADFKSLVADDAGDTDLGDLQYVLFNLVALAFFLSTLLANPRDAFPQLPQLLVGLALTSAATYTAKQAAASAAGPQLTSIFPPVATAGQPMDLFGQNLVSAGRAPSVAVGAAVVDRVDVVTTAGAGDHLRFRVPTGVVGERVEVRVVDPATGASARGPGGTDFLAIEVRAASASVAEGGGS